MKKYITPCNYDISLEDIKTNLKPEPIYADIPIQDLEKLSIVHSDLAFINSEGKLSLVEDWKYGYKKYGEKGLKNLQNDVAYKFGDSLGPENNTHFLVESILLKAGELDGILKF